MARPIGWPTSAERMTTFFAILQLPVRHDGEDEFVRRFAELGIFELCGSRTGLLAARLLRPADRGEPFVVVSEWDGEESYRAWIADPERNRVNAGLLPFLEGELRGGLYNAAESWRAEDGRGGGRA